MCWDSYGVHTLFLMPDVHIAHPAFGTGYPQTNEGYEPYVSYDGNVNRWMIQDPIGWSTTWVRHHAPSLSALPPAIADTHL